MTPPADSIRTQARATRADVETALDASGWRWNLALSRWLDVLLKLEEAECQALVTRALAELVE